MARKLKLAVNAIPAANPVTGIGRYVIELYDAVRALAGSDIEVRYFDGRALTPEPPRGPRDVQSFSRLARWFWKLPTGVAVAVRLAMHRRRERLFRRLAAGFDVYHETAFFPFTPPPGTRVVQTIHDLSLQLHPEWHPAERVAYAERFFRPRLEWAAHVFCVSGFTRGELLAYEPAVAERTSITPLGVNARFRPAAEAERRRVRERHSLPGRYVLALGSGDPRKNIAALARVHARGALPCPLVSVGWEGWEEQRAAGIVSLGYVADEDLPALYGEAAAFVFPSLYEGFGLPVLEAMACGCPVVVPRAHSMPELVGEAGVYYGEPGDDAALERALRDLTGDEPRRAALAAAGLERARRFDWAGTARLTVAGIERALARRV